jgi:hypothetical protein
MVEKPFTAEEMVIFSILSSFPGSARSRIFPTHDLFVILIKKAAVGQMRCGASPGNLPYF